MHLLDSKHTWATSYPPIANGVVKCFQRQLETSLKAHFNLKHWTESLPMVILGIRTALKEDIHCTAAELVYGTTWNLPGEILSSHPDGHLTYLVKCVAELKAAMSQL